MEDSLREELESCDREQLVDIVGELVEEHSDVRPYLKLLLASRRGDPEALDMEGFVGRVDEVFSRAWDRNAGRYEVTVRLARALRGFKEVADQRRASGDAAGAARRYAHLARRIAEEYMTFHDSSGKLGGLWHDILREVGDCYSEVAESEVRESVRKDLASVREFEDREITMGLTRHIEGILDDL
ncbi:MAG: hypothetical protein ABEL76_02395 [Bradymonadaceae bacterium]